MSKEDLRVNGSTYSQCAVGEDWHQFSKEMSDTMELIASTHAEVKTSIPHLKLIGDTLKGMNENLITAVAGKRQIPLDAVLAFMFLFTVYQVVVMVKDGHKNVKLNLTDGLVIEEIKVNEK